MRTHRLAHTPTAMTNVVMLPKRVGKLNRLGGQDRDEAASWRLSLAGRHYRLDVCIDPYQDEDIGDFILVYLLSQPWATWGVARRGDRVLLWQCADGADIGLFETVRAALAGLPLHPPGA